MSDDICLDHDETKSWTCDGYRYCVTCRRIQVAVEAEREACALEGERFARNPSAYEGKARSVIEAIRARGGK